MVRTSVRALPVLVVVAVLAGCGGGSSPSPSTSASTDRAAEARVPSVDGEIAVVGDNVMQVQGSSMQTTVTWDDATKITAQTAATLADVTVGACVMAATEDDTATTVQISTPTDGTCTAGRGGPGAMPPGMPTDMPTDGSRPRPTDMPTDMPSGMPTDMPTDMPSGMAPGGQRGTAGQVTEVTGTTITVQADDDTTSTITVGSGTTYVQRVDADASALVVGQCVSARGDQDKAGNLTATSIEVSAPADSGCSTAARGPGGPGQPGGPGAPRDGRTSTDG